MNYRSHENPTELPASIESKEQFRHYFELAYRENITELNRCRMLEFSPENGELGIRDENGKWYRIPTFEEVWELCELNWALVQEKWQQGFTRLQLTPIAAPIYRFVQRIETALHQQAQQKKLYRLESENNVVTKHLTSVDPAPVHWDGLKTQRIKRALLYFPDRFSKTDSNGMTKNELLQQTADRGVAGWNIGLLENHAFFPIYEAELKNGRFIFPTNWAAEKYLEKLNNVLEPMYEGESGTTVEDLLMFFLESVSRTGIINMDWYPGTAVYALGNIIANTQAMPTIYWIPMHSRLYVTESNSFSKSSSIGCRTMVRLMR